MSVTSIVTDLNHDFDIIGVRGTAFINHLDNLAVALIHPDNTSGVYVILDEVNADAYHQNPEARSEMLDRAWIALNHIMFADDNGDVEENQNAE